MPSTYYCPMCGAWFEVGAERCTVCSAPLPEIEPDLSAMEQATILRSHGLILARSALARGARLQAGHMRLMILPLVAALALAWVTQEVALGQSRGVKGGAAGMPVGWMVQPPGGGWQAILNALAGKALSLFFPFSFAQEMGASLATLGFAVPPAGVDQAPAMAAQILGAPALPSHLVRFAALFRGIYSAVIMILNVLQWHLIVGLLGRTREGGGPRAANYRRAVVPLLLLVALPVAAAQWRSLLTLQFSIGGTLLLALTAPALMAWSTASLYGPPTGVDVGYLVRRSLLSAEGILFLLMSVPLLWIAQVALFIWLGAGTSGLAVTDPLVGYLVGAGACGLAFGLTSLVACGWFCLLDALAGRTDLAAMLEQAEQPRATPETGVCL